MGLIGSAAPKAPDFRRRPRRHGQVFIGDQTEAARISSPKAVAAGIAMITEDRKSQGLLLPHDRFEHHLSKPS